LGKIRRIELKYGKRDVVLQVRVDDRIIDMLKGIPIYKKMDDP
jgi:hypothetical protein